MPKDQVREHIDEGEQEQPDHVNEVPVPGSKLEPEMLFGGHIIRVHTDQADGQEDRSDDNVCPVEAGRHEE